MKWFIIFSLLSLVSAAHAEVSPEHVSDMLDQMVRENVISAEEAAKAKIRMQNMNREQWSAINVQAAKVASRSPASAVPSENRIEEVKGIDLEGQQFKQIQDDIKKIMPSYKD